MKRVLGLTLALIALLAAPAWACVGIYPPVGHIESDTSDLSTGHLQDGMGFISSTSTISTILGMACPNHVYASQAEADTAGLTYEIWLAEDLNGDGRINVMDDLTAVVQGFSLWTLGIHVVCDGSPGHVPGWDGHEANLLQGGVTISVVAGRAYVAKLRIYDTVGNTNTEVGGSDVWYTSGAESYIDRNGTVSQGLDDNEVLWIRVPVKPPPNVGGGIGTLPANTTTSTTPSTTTSTTTTLPGATTTTSTTTTTTTTLPPGDPALLSTGAGLEQCNGNYYELGTYAGQPSYKHFCIAPVGPNHDMVVWIWWGFDNKWRMGNCPGGAVVYYWSLASAWPEAPILWPWYAVGPYGVAPTPSTYFWTP